MTETQPTRQEKIAKIYEVIMCVVKETRCRDCLAKEGLRYVCKGCDGRCIDCGREGADMGLSFWKNSDKKGRCMVGDFLSWIKRRNEHLFIGNSDMYIFYKCYKNIGYRDKYREPIDSQSDDCVDYVYNLCK